MFSDIHRLESQLRQLVGSDVVPAIMAILQTPGMLPQKALLVVDELLQAYYVSKQHVDHYGAKSLPRFLQVVGYGVGMLSPDSGEDRGKARFYYIRPATSFTLVYDVRYDVYWVGSLEYCESVIHDENPVED